MITVKNEVSKNRIIGVRDLKEGETAIIVGPYKEYDYTGTIVLKVKGDTKVVDKNTCNKALYLGNYLTENHPCKLVNIDIIVKDLS